MSTIRDRSEPGNAGTGSFESNAVKAGADAGHQAADAAAQAGASREKAAQRVVDAKAALEDADHLEAEAKAAEHNSKAQAARERAAQFMSERKYAEARKALGDAEKYDEKAAGSDRHAQAKLVREHAAAMMAAHDYAGAKKALEEADDLESGSPGWKTGPRRIFDSVRSRIPGRSHSSDTSAADQAEPMASAAAEPVQESARLVSLYSKIAIVAGLLPGGLLNFGAILAVQVIMVWRISNAFGHHEGREKIRGSILSLFGSVLPTGIGHGAGLAIASIPALISGALVYFLVTPVLAYAMTKAVGNVFTMHFESGGTLLTFDPKAFGEYFVNEFKNAGGTVSTSAPASPVIVPA